MAKAGKASVSKTSARASSEKVSSESVASNTNGGLGINNVFSNVLGNKKQSGPKKAQSILFGAAKGLKLFD